MWQHVVDDQSDGAKAESLVTNLREGLELGVFTSKNHVLSLLLMVPLIDLKALEWY